jgi:hypothetical protein
MIRSKAVDYVRVPAVHVGVEVPQKEQRNRARFAESAVGITDAVGFNKLCGDRFVCVIAHRLAASKLPAQPVIDFLAPKWAYAYECNHWTILNLLRRYDLGLSPILIAEEFLYGEENAIDYARCCDRVG